MKCFVLLAVLGFAQISLTYGAECQADTTWSTPCHECSCSKEGLAKCSPKSCQDESGSSAEPPHCKAGSRWKDDCNTCFCTEDGFAACTKIGCVSIKPPAGLNFDDSVRPKESVSLPLELTSAESNNRVKRQVCTPNSNFQRECNVCKCDREGASYSCTQNECMGRGRGNGDVEVFMENEGIDHIEQESVCHSRTTFQVNCNTCVCNADGTDYRCTENACPLPADVELFKELKDETHIVPLKKCDPSGVFHDGCNECRCNENGTDYTCTKTICKGFHGGKTEKNTSTKMEPIKEPR